jgi:hypothetical protein
VEAKTIETISKNVHRRYPEVSGTKPTVRKQPIPKSAQNKITAAKPNYLLTYKKEAKGPLGKSIPCWVRVVATPDGKILKITTSK